MRPAVSGQVRLVADFEGRSTQSDLKVPVECAEHEPSDLSLAMLKQDIEARPSKAISADDERCAARA
jgi:hypothetical protein